MSIASESKNCPKCGATIPAEAPQGLCPKCLLLEISTPTDAGQGANSKSIPPTRDELATAFPQLEILELIGQGGMGFVFKARQPKLDRFVALKILPQSLAADPAFAERFTREGRLLARLNHPNIVTVHDFGVASGVSPDVEQGFQPGGKDADENQREKITDAQANASVNPRGRMPRSTSGGTPDATGAAEFFYLLMEFVDGVNLRQAMRAGRFTADQALAVVPKICEALQFAHNEGILHRDIKPENILLDTKGRVKIADFGIAKLVSEASGRVELPLDPNIKAAQQRRPTDDLTQTGKTLGTPNYMAPEQIEKSGQVDHRADIYSLGVVFYEMLTGELPLGRFAPPSQKSSADPRLDDVVLRALEKEPNRRTQSAGEVKTQVETIAMNQPPPISDAPNLSPKPKWFVWRGLKVSASMFFLVVLATTVVTLLLPKTYQAVARVGLRPPVTEDSSEYYFQPLKPYWVRTQMEIIQSNLVLERVVLKQAERQSNQKRRLNLTLSESVAVIKNSMSVRQTGNTSLIEIRFYSESQREAAWIANEIARSYVESTKGQSEIVDFAVPPSRAVRPNTFLNISVGILAGLFLGVIAGLTTSLISYWRNRPTVTQQSSMMTAPPDRFWKRFAVVVGLVLLALILIPIIAMLLAIALPAFTKAREKTQTVREQIEKSPETNIRKTTQTTAESTGSREVWTKLEEAWKKLVEIQKKYGANSSQVSEQRRVIDELASEAGEENASKRVCIGNLRQIGGAKEMWRLENKKQKNDLPTITDLLPYLGLDQKFPVCPSRGTYDIRSVGDLPTCSIPNHQIPAEKPVSFGSPDILETRAKLAELRIEYTDGHPVVKAQMARLRELERITKEEPNASAALREAKAKLAEMRTEFTDGHPEVRKLKERVRELEDK